MRRFSVELNYWEEKKRKRKFRDKCPKRVILYSWKKRKRNGDQEKYPMT